MKTILNIGLIALCSACALANAAVVYETHREVIREDEPETIVRVVDQMLASFPDHPAALIALCRGRIALGDADLAIEKLSAALPRIPEDIPVREALVLAFEKANDTAGAQRVYAEIAELYKRQGDHDRATLATP